MYWYLILMVDIHIVKEDELLKVYQINHHYLYELNK